MDGLSQEFVNEIPLYFQDWYYKFFNFFHTLLYETTLVRVSYTLVKYSILNI